LSFIEDRLRELEKEREELSEYEQLDKNRRALEYNLYNNELTKANEQLVDVENLREGKLHIMIITAYDICFGFAIIN
jgi:structural maintenance of chromosome 3 (chondroitin sulfate proteoglycan 6)